MIKREAMGSVTKGMKDSTLIFRSRFYFETEQFKKKNTILGHF